MLLANFDRKEHLRHRAVSLRQHGFLVFTVFDVSLNDVMNYVFAFIGSRAAKL